MDAFLSQIYSPSLALILLIIAVVAEVVLAFTVYQSNPKSATNKIFAILSISTILWLINNYVTNSLPAFPSLWEYAVYLGRTGIFFAAPMSTLFFLLAHTIPSEKIQMGRGTFYAVIASTLLMMGVNLSPYAFTSVHVNSVSVQLQPGAGLLPFSVLSTLFSVLALGWLIWKFHHTEGVVQKQIRLVLIGILTMLTLIIATVLVPILFSNPIQFLSLTPLYTLIFLGMTAYAITKYQLFQVKVIVSKALIGVIWLILFARIYGENTVSGQIIDTLILLFVVIFGVLLVRSVEREVQEREIIQRQKEELEKANADQENLIHFITHQVKGFFTKSRNAFSMLLDGDYGQLSETMKPVIEEGFNSDTKGVAMVQEILSAANMKKGTLTYKQEPVDISQLAGEIVASLTESATAKGLTLTLKSTGIYTITGDREQLEHALRNLVDNSIKYTPTGSVTVTVEKKGTSVRVSVTDTGVGITPEDKQRLFTEGGRGKDSIKVNVDSTGYGLYIVKNIIEAHKGTVTAESAGAGKGSTFTILLPLSK